MYEEFRLKLIESLPMDDVYFLGLLRKQKLFPGSLLERVKSKATKADKNDLFLSNAIEPSLDIGKFEPLNKLLTVMRDEEYLKDDLMKSLSAEIVEEIGTG